MPEQPQDVPEEAVKAVAEMLLRDYDSEHNADHLSWKDFAGQARRLLAIGAPHIERQVRERVAEQIEDEDRDPGSEYERGLNVAARIARGES